MAADEKPVLIAYDGSDHAKQAIQQAAAELRMPRKAVVMAAYQPLDALPDGQLAALAMPLDRALVATGATRSDRRLSLTQIADERRQRIVVRPDLGRRGIEPAAQDVHRPMIGRHP